MDIVRPILIDTSVWIDVFRGKTPALAALVKTLLEDERAVLCDVVTAEIRVGLRASERRKVVSLLEAVTAIPVTPADWAEAGDLGSSLRSSGRTLPLTDLLIAVLCIRSGFELLTLDDHFSGIEGLLLVRL